MWLSSQSRKTQRSDQGAETGVVTLEGEKTAVYLTGERRNLPVLSPGGYCWRPAEGETVLVLKSGADGEELWVAGVPGDGTDLAPGEVRIQSRQAAVFLGNDGSIDLRGTVKINGVPMEELFEPKVKEEGGLG
ncbi:hypothetical protein [Intestinimonas timonensis]|uniref:hypothetical protein n=1 Tax=Intestinimonas timonensis TaxID=1689270 RepID=UPI003A932F69